MNEISKGEVAEAARIDLQSKQKVIYYTGTLINTGAICTGRGGGGRGEVEVGGLNLLILGRAAAPVLT